jgi:U3 small nucleolar RNA-associated protein 22
MSGIMDEKPRFPFASHKPKEGRKGQQEVVEARELYTWRFIHAPRHHRATAILCHRFTPYTGTVRLVKRWLASHWLLYGHIGEEAVELICAALFIGDRRVLGSGQASVPGTRERGFAAVVEYLKDRKWEEGLFLPLYSSSEASGESSTKVVATAGSKHGVWTISTKEGQAGHIWT